jgi:hypothetical protein
VCDRALFDDSGPTRGSDRPERKSNSGRLNAKKPGNEPGFSHLRLPCAFGTWRAVWAKSIAGV